MIFLEGLRFFQEGLRLYSGGIEIFFGEGGVVGGLRNIEGVVEKLKVCVKFSMGLRNIPGS